MGKNENDKNKVVDNHNSKEVANPQYEYGKPEEFDKLEGNRALFIRIPASLILASDQSNKRASVFSFFSTRCGMDGSVGFSVNKIVEWCGSKPNVRDGSTNDKYIKAISYVRDEGYIDVDDSFKPSSYSEAKFNVGNVNDECNADRSNRKIKHRFAKIYLDELEKVMRYNKGGKKDNYFSNDALLLVFSYLRMVIPRRGNLMNWENVGVHATHSDDVAAVRLSHPEAYEVFYKDIAKDLGLKPRAVSKAVDILKELKLIWYKTKDRTETSKDVWRTEKAIFCNYEKREAGRLFASGIGYYNREIMYKEKNNEMYHR